VRQVLVKGEDTILEEDPPLVPVPDLGLPFNPNDPLGLHDPFKEPELFDGDILEIIARLTFKCKDLICRHIDHGEVLKLKARLDALLKEKRDLLASIEIEPSYTDPNGTIHNFPGEDFASSIIAERGFHLLKIQEIENRIDFQNNSLDILGRETNTIRETIGSLKEILNLLRPNDSILKAYYNDQISRLEDILDRKNDEMQRLGDSINKLHDDIKRRKERIAEIDSLLDMVVPKEAKDKDKLSEINQSINAINLLLKTCITPVCTATDKECKVMPA
jgi:vacuolar-type H+-ATPase subunit I/STV1